MKSSKRLAVEWHFASLSDSSFSMADKTDLSEGLREAPESDEFASGTVENSVVDSAEIALGTTRASSARAARVESDFAQTDTNGMGGG